MATIRLDPMQGQMSCGVSGAAAFPGMRFGLGLPEAIGDAARPVWFGGVDPLWEELADGAWRQMGRVEGELSYRITVAPSDDCVDQVVELTNESGRTWEHSLAFNCFQCGGVPQITDHECLRHWVCSDGSLMPLREVPRQYGPRPTVQLYSVEGSPPGEEVPFVANFAATPRGVVLEGWMGIRSRDGRCLAITASKPCLCLFQNMEYSCIHASPSLGSLEPGETGRALNRIYLVEATLEEWHGRYRAEMH